MIRLGKYDYEKVNALLQKWEGRTLGITEHGTEKSNNLEVKCPKCGHEFKVCCEW